MGRNIWRKKTITCSILFRVDYWNDPSWVISI